MTQQPRSTFVLREPSEILGALVGLKDVVVLHYKRRGPDVELAIEQLIRQPVRCPGCSELAQVKERPVVTYIDLPVYGTPMRLGWKKHRMRCVNAHCTKRFWVLRDHRITTSGTVTSYGSVYSPTLITSGPDGALWFTSYYGDYIGRITTSGTVTSYTNSGISEPDGITSGQTVPCGSRIQAVFPSAASPPRVASLSTPTGILTDQITTGPDGALWFTDGAFIGRITTSGTFTFYYGPTATDGFTVPNSIAVGP